MKVLSLEKILNLENWQQIQDSLSKATKLAIITVDYKGIPITTHSCCNSFCTKVRSDPDLRALCQKCDSRAGLEASDPISLLFISATLALSMSLFHLLSMGTTLVL